MKNLTATMVAFVVLISFSCNKNMGKADGNGEKSKVTFIENVQDNSVDVMVDNQLFTSFRWPEKATKPMLYPIINAGGTEITRGFPLNPKVGERADHPHQMGMWLTYGKVDGNDFWGNGSHGLGTKNDNGGFIKEVKVNKTSAGTNEGVLKFSSQWIGSDGVELLNENTEFHFIAEGSLRIIDRITTLTSIDKEVKFDDTKEGMFGIRVARQLELPSQGTMTLLNAAGEPEKVKAMSTDGITGNYMSSEGGSGLEVWGSRAKWMDLYGNIGDEKVSLVICDHPKNVNYPTWWHARGYGLFAANPFGAKDFTEGKQSINFSIPKKGSVTFRYRTIISSGNHLTADQINSYADDFAKKY